MIKIMFICTGNICRSAMAEAIMKEELKNRGKEEEIFVCSAGTFAENGDYASYHAIEAMEYYEIDLKSHRATNLTKSNVEDMDIILCATKDHKRIVTQLYPKLEGKVYTMKEFANVSSEDGSLDIKDPWGYSLQVFLDCAKEIKLCIDKTLDKVIDK